MNDAMNLKNNKKKASRCYFVSALLLMIITAFSAFVLSATIPLAHADSSVVTTFILAVPTSCSMTGTIVTPHSATIYNGIYSGVDNVSGIGQTTLKVYCNDNAGFAIYAIGYTNDELGNNKLHWSGAISTSDTTNDINTGIYNSSSTTNSTWSMKLSSISGTYAPTISDGTNNTENFTNWHVVPNVNTKVAYRLTGTDASSNNTGTGSSLSVTYDTYISTTQPAGSYSGQVKYTLVHPNDIPIPDETMLDTGQVVSAKMKTLAAGGTSKAYNEKTSDIKAIRMADSLPNGFVASDANTVSTSTSRHPIYIFFDNTNDAGIMYFYTGGYQVVMNPDSSHLFRSNLALSDISGLASWDSSKVTNMYAMFGDSVVSLTNVDALIAWDTSSVENMYAVFALGKTTQGDGYISSLSDISGLINWDTGNVTNMSCMFQRNTRLASLHGLEFWDVSNVENMSSIFSAYLSNGSIFTDLSPIANWDTGNVTNMSFMFHKAIQLTDLSPIANWDTGNVTSMRSMFWGTVRLTDLSPLANWDTGNVTDMSRMFAMDAGKTRVGNPIIDLSPLSGWDVSKVTDMHIMFQNTNIASFLPLSNWDVSKVQNFSGMFNQTSSSTTTSLAGLEDWDVSSATCMYVMFSDSFSLQDASAINDWDIQNVPARCIPWEDGLEANSFVGMFYNSPTHPTFTKRAGTWDSDGTFTPSS